MEALDALSLYSVILDADGRCTKLSPGAAALLAEGALLTLRLSRLRCSNSATAVAACPRTAGPIDLDHQLAPCIGCLTGQPLQADGQRCSISISDSHDRSLHVRLTPMPRHDREAFSEAAVLLVIEPIWTPRSAELLPDIAVILTAAEREVATELLGGLRPTDIAHRRRVAVGTIRSQIKRIYAKLGVSGVVEFIAKARR